MISLRHSLSVNIEGNKKGDEFSQSMEKIKKEIPSLKESLKASIGVFFEEIVGIEEGPEKIKEDIKTRQGIEFQTDKREVKPAKLPVIE
jgi:hypothetical protein